jgi:HK97 gp10 family phage protein
VIVGSSGGWIEVKGLSELTDKLNKLPDKLAKRLFVRAISQGAKVIQDEVAVRAPVRQPGPHERAGKPIATGKSELRYPGNLKRQIVRRKVKREGQKVTYQVKPTPRAWYGRLVETGTRFAAAKPFMRPAIDAKGEASIKRVAEVIEAGLPEEVK